MKKNSWEELISISSNQTLQEPEQFKKEILQQLEKFYFFNFSLQPINDDETPGVIDAYQLELCFFVPFTQERYPGQKEDFDMLCITIFNIVTIHPYHNTLVLGNCCVEIDLEPLPVSSYKACMLESKSEPFNHNLLSAYQSVEISPLQDFICMMTSNKVFPWLQTNLLATCQQLSGHPAMLLTPKEFEGFMQDLQDNINLTIELLDSKIDDMTEKANVQAYMLEDLFTMLAEHAKTQLSYRLQRDLPSISFSLPRGKI